MDKHNLYTITQLARACSISRATVLRLEADGLLTPVMREGTGEYRYFDCASIMHVLQILSLQKLGFTRDEIHEYFRIPGDFSHCLSVLTARLEQLKAAVKRMQLRVDLTHHMKIEEVHIPETVCYVKSIQTFGDYFVVNDLTQAAFKEAVTAGLPIDCTKDYFSLVDCPDLLKGKQPDRPHHYSICIPLLAKKGTPHTVAVPPCHALAITWFHGQKESRNQAYQALGQALRERRLTSSEPLRVFGIIHQYMGSDISVERNVIRIAQPVLCLDAPPTPKP